MKPVLNERKCPVQEQICRAIPACPKAAISNIVDANAPLGGRIVFDYEKSNECGICVTECYGLAIDLK